METSIQLVIFSGTPFKLDRTENQNRSIDLSPESDEKKAEKYAKPLAKIRVRAIFPPQDTWRKVLPNQI